MASREKTLALAAALFGLGVAPVRAGSGPGTSTAEFLRIPVGARPAALSEAFTGLADDVHALAYNPAGLALLRRKEFGVGHDAYADGVYHEWFGYAHPTGFATFGLAANILYVEPFNAYDADDWPTDKSGAMDSSYQFSFAKPLSNSLALGGSGKLISSKLYNNQAQTFAVDAGLLWEAAPRLRLGLALLNLGPGLKYQAERMDLPMVVRAGASWTPLPSDDFPHWFTLVFDATKPRYDSLAMSGGAELWYENLLALRLGGRSDAGDGPGYTAGMGVYLFRGQHKGYELGFDYAFVDSGEFAQTHRISLSFKFGDKLRDEDRVFVIGGSRYDGATAPKPGSRAARKAAAEAPSRRPPPTAEPVVSPDAPRGESKARPAGEEGKPSRRLPPTGEPVLSPDFAPWSKP